MTPNLTIVVGGQAGSEGKGAVCLRLCRERDYGFSVRVGGPNAGHTVYTEDGKKLALRQLPAAAAYRGKESLVIAQGSEVELARLQEEIAEIEDSVGPIRGRLIIDPQATVLEGSHPASEQEISTGTTGQGVGAARAARALRQAKLIGDVRGAEIQGCYVSPTASALRAALHNRKRVIVEGAQGFILGSHAGSYPHCTSTDCTAADCLAQCGLAPQEADVWVVLRSHPIRIAGASGPLPSETSWEALGVPAELTTVTQKPRRVGEWNWEWPRAAVEANSSPTRRPTLALTHLDYRWPELCGADGPARLNDLPRAAAEWIERVQRELGARVGMVGTGPHTQLILPL